MIEIIKNQPLIIINYIKKVVFGLSLRDIKKNIISNFRKFRDIY
jgi:hypothetical protein